MRYISVITIFSLIFLLGLSVQSNNRIFCQFSGRFFEKLRSSIPEGEIPNVRELIEKECSSNPIYSILCQEIILPNIDRLSDHFGNELNFEELIRTINGHCNSEESQASSEEQEIQQVNAEVSLPEIKPCEACLFFMSFLQNEIGDDLSEENIRHYLNGACNQFELGSRYCKRIVNDNFDLLVDIIQNKVTPAEICTYRLQFCDADFWETDFSQTSFKCELCEFIIDYIYRKIGNDNNMNKIEQVLQNVCNVLPIGKNLCKEMVSHFLPRLKEYLLNRFPPNLICTKINMCKTAYYEQIQDLAAVVYLKEYIEKHPFEVQAMGSSSECQFCQWTVSAVQAWLSDGHTQTEIALFLNQLCNFFGSYAPQCEQLVRVYVPKWLDSIIEKQTPPLVCSNFGVCKI